jgi:glycosyltransferase involved in cell wall biosynthesis
MNVLHVVTNLDPKLGGSVEAARQTAIGMSASGAHNEVLSLVSPRPDWLQAWPVRVHAVGNTVGQYQFTRDLVPWFRQNHSRYDVVLVHGVWRYSSLGVWRALRRMPTPYCLFTHGMLDPWFQRAYRLKHLKKAAFWRLAEHRVLRDAKAVLFTSDEERRLARESFRPYRCREQVVGLGTEAPPRDAANQVDEFFRRFPHLRGKRIMLCLSRIHRKKGCDLLIESFGAVARKDPRLALVLAGPDDEGWRPELEKLARMCQVAHRITWTGQIEGSLKWGAFRAAEVFVLPSHSENYGIAIVEAMACGTPVLITDKVNIWREIQADDGGLVASDDLAGTTDLLQRWCSLSAERIRLLGAHASLCFLSRFELGSFAGRFINYLAIEIAKGKGRALCRGFLLTV